MDEAGAGLFHCDVHPWVQQIGGQSLDGGSRWRNIEVGRWDAKGHCMFTHVTHVGQTVVICCRSLWYVSTLWFHARKSFRKTHLVGRLIPYVCLIRYGIPRFCCMPNATDPSLPPTESTLHMICFLYLSGCLFFLHLPIKKLHLQPGESAVTGGYRTRG